MPNSRFFRLAQYAILVYVLFSVLYASNFLLASSIGSTILSLLVKTTDTSEGYSEGLAVRPRVDLITRARHILEAQRRSEALAWTTDSSSDLVYWTLPDIDNADSLVNDDTVPILENTVLSKAFAQALHPTRLIPFYYKATSVVDQDDVTITTLVTSNRYKVLKQLVERYQGDQKFLAACMRAECANQGPSRSPFTSLCLRTGPTMPPQRINSSLPSRTWKLSTHRLRTSPPTSTSTSRSRPSQAPRNPRP